jgi:hypothetical protein
MAAASALCEVVSSAIDQSIAELPLSPGMMVES